MSNHINNQPINPEDYNKRVLLVSVGISPQVLTETLYALVVTSQQAFVPTKIIITTTSVGKEKCIQQLIKEGHYQRLIDTYNLYQLPKPSEIEYRLLEDEHQVLEDVRSNEDSKLAANALARIVQDITQDKESALHISLAGGRKTQSYYIGFALSLYRRSQDRLSHVLIPDEVIADNDVFFFPTKEKILLKNSGYYSNEVPVELTYLPFLPMREHLLPKQALTYNDIDFSDVIHRIDLGEGEVDLTLDINFNQQTLTTKGVKFDLTGKELLLAYLAMFYFDLKNSVKDNDYYGIEMPTRGKRSSAFTKSFLRSYIKVLKVLNPNILATNKSIEQLIANAKELSNLLEDCNVHTKTFDAFIKNNQLEDLTDSFASTRRTELKRLLEQQLPKNWIDKLLPYPDIQDETNQGKSTKVNNGHIINLPLSRFKVIGLD